MNLLRRIVVVLVILLPQVLIIPLSEVGATAPDMVIELRRTFSSSDCDTGEILIDGRLVALFEAAPSLFSKNFPSRQLTIGEASTVHIADPMSLGDGTHQGFLFDSTGPNRTQLRFLMLNDRTYSAFKRPRAKKAPLPQDLLVVGSTVINRECLITTAKDRGSYNDTDNLFWYTSDFLGRIIFGDEGSYAKFKSGKNRTVVTVFSDRSRALTISFGNMSFSLEAPIRSAAKIAQKDLCLTRIEDLGNTIISRGGARSYERRDDVWNCTDGAFVGDPSGRAIEARRDVRFIELWSHEICGSILGIPKPRVFYLGRTGDGTGSHAWSQCFATDPFKVVSDTVKIDMR